ncbi:MAG: peptide MFS transporter [Myxococcota bacterium]
MRANSAADGVRKEDLPHFAGHPTGLFMLFFAEMWERFSYYGMRALLVLYIIKGFLGRNDVEAYKIYGAYAALVYATPFIGGLLADRLLGARRAVILGGVLMAMGHLTMTIESELPFFTALALLIVGNGFFKPNISTIVGSLYPENSPRRDGGFTIFYIGINLGAAMAPLLCGYVGEKFGWHYGFGLATIGMLVGLAVFVAPAGLTRLIILFTALFSGGLMVYLNLGEVIYALGPNALVALFLTGAGAAAFLAIGRGGLPDWAGAPPDMDALKRPVLGPLTAEWAVYLGAILTVPVFALLVQFSDVAGYTLSLFGGIAFIYLIYLTVISPRIERDRMIVVLVLMFFSMLFWAFFEQAGSSINLFTDRNVDRVFETEVVTEAMIGQTVEVAVTQELTGRTMGDKVITMTDIDGWRDEKVGTVDWPVSEDDVGMGTAGSEVATSQFQAANPVYIMLFGLAFTALWTFLGKRKLEPSTPVKFGLGILQLGLGFAALWWAAAHPDARGMVEMSWLLLAYLLITTGELCLSPVGLSMVTKLAPARIVSMVMGAWFLATAFSNYLSALIAILTGVSHEEGGDGSLPPPIETVGVYAEVFGPIAIAAVVSALVIFALSPGLSYLMHMDEEELSSGSGH